MNNKQIASELVKLASKLVEGGRSRAQSLQMVEKKIALVKQLISQEDLTPINYAKPSTPGMLRIEAEIKEIAGLLGDVAEGCCSEKLIQALWAASK